MGAPPTSQDSPRSARLDSVDLLRGLVMVLMALDHIRDFFSNATIEPEDLTRTTPLFFLTRWITHFCAPTFVFLAGTGAFLYGARGRTPREVSWFLGTRGLWLVILEVTLVQWGWSFNISYQFIVGQVIWAIGASMIALSLLVRLPLSWIAGIGIAMIAGHNALDGVRFEESDWRFGPWAFLHGGQVVRINESLSLLPLYPLIPWIGVMAVGYAFGAIVLRPPSERQAWMLRVGAGLTAAFFVLRLSNLYGDPSPWAPQPNPVFSFLSILNCSKYPPSLLYLLMTLGPALILLALFDRFPLRSFGWLVTFGRVPLFYYLLHLYLVHASAGLLSMLAGRPEHARWVFRNAFFGDRPEGYGFPLWAVYLVWIVLVAILYPLCRWYAGVKQRHRHPLLSYL